MTRTKPIKAKSIRKNAIAVIPRRNGSMERIPSKSQEMHTINMYRELVAFRWYLNGIVIAKYRSTLISPTATIDVDKQKNEKKAQIRRTVHGCPWKASYKRLVLDKGVTDNPVKKSLTHKLPMSKFDGVCKFWCLNRTASTAKFPITAASDEKNPITVVAIAVALIAWLSGIDSISRKMHVPSDCIDPML